MSASQAPTAPATDTTTTAAAATTTAAAADTATTIAAATTAAATATATATPIAAPTTAAATMNNDYVLVNTDQILKRKKNLLWAQTMPDASFGLFSSLTPSLPFKILITSKFVC